MLLLATKVQQSIFYQKPTQIANAGFIKRKYLILLILIIFDTMIIDFKKHE
jgi:hypothetical protein